MTSLARLLTLSSLAIGCAVAVSIALRVYSYNIPSNRSHDVRISPTADTEISQQGLQDLINALAPPVSSGASDLAKRFRLAGVIMGGFNGGVEEPMAVLDDRVLVRQSVVSRGEEVVSGVVLTKVTTASVILSGPEGSEEILLERSNTPSREVTATTSENFGATADGAASTASTREEAAARFGGREVFPNRWEYDRDKLIEYYDELRAEPERLLSIFDTMDPNWVEDESGHRRIDGYKVDIKGESEFFLASGLKNGDIVRTVNKAAMTNRRIAEGLIASFIEGSGTMFVIEFERDGQMMREVVEIKQNGE